MPTFTPSIPDEAVVTFAEGSTDEKGEIKVQTSSNWNDVSILGTFVFDQPKPENFKYIVQIGDSKYILGELYRDESGFEVGSEREEISHSGNYRFSYVIHELG